MSSLFLTPYSEKSFVVRGNLEKYGDVLKNIGGLYNSKLRGGEGYIFSNGKKEQITSLIEKISIDASLFGNKEKPQQVSIKDFTNLLMRVEKLEYLLKNMMKLNEEKSQFYSQAQQQLSVKQENTKDTDNGDIDNGETDNEENDKEVDKNEEKPMKRLLKH